MLNYISHISIICLISPITEISFFSIFVVVVVFLIFMSFCVLTNHAKQVSRTILPPKHFLFFEELCTTRDLHTNKISHLPAASHPGQILPLKGISKPAGFGLPCFY